MMIMKAKIVIEKQNKLMEDDYRIEPSVIIWNRCKANELGFYSFYLYFLCVSASRAKERTKKQTSKQNFFFLFLFFLNEFNLYIHRQCNKIILHIPSIIIINFYLLKHKEFNCCALSV
jgi:hypothetical protein